MTLIEFTKKAAKIHGGTYSYDNVLYKNTNTKVCIICPIHGDFWQTPNNHLQGRGCPKCAKVSNMLKLSYNAEEFMKKAKEMHDNKYDYSEVVYKDTHTKVCIICPVHGKFWQRPNDHLKGCGCPKCNSSHLEKTTL